MRKLVIFSLPVLMLAAVGCSDVRRDFTYCDSVHECNYGFSCDQDEGICKPGDAGLKPTTPDAPITPDTTPTDVTVPDTADVAVERANDLPVVFDVLVVDQTVEDLPVVDVLSPIEVAQPDTRVPDAAGSCAVDNDCARAAGAPYCVKAKCVACKTSANCDNAAGTPFCSAQNTCVSCALATGVDGGSGCPSTAPVCNSSTGSCVECTHNSDCNSSSAKSFCVQNKCTGCDTPGASSGGAGVDGGAAGSGSSQCPANKPVCVPSTNTTSTKAGQCVGCLDNSNCSGSTPVCNASNTCVPCTSDDQCTTGPGVCMFHQDGRCATDTETMYVKNSNGCTGGSGGPASPYCQPQSAISALSSSSKRVIAIQGGTPVGTFATSSALGTQQVSIVGLNQPIISAGAADMGIHLVSGNFYIRGLKIQGAGSATITPSMPGVVVESGATLAMDRCYVLAFAGGLLINPGANFDIANSAFAANVSGQFGTATFFGGVYLGGSAPKAGPSRFWFNTIVGNSDRGIICYEATQALSGILASGNSGGDYATCAMDKTSVWASGRTSTDGTSSYIGDLSVDSSYHISATNHCRDLLDSATAHPADDIDGKTRPNGTKLDCGADEYYAN